MGAKKNVSCRRWPVVALHGNLGAPSDWDAVERFLGQSIDKFDVFAKPPVSFGATAEDLCNEARNSGGRPLLIGYSLGGRLALHALLADPSVWAGAVIVSAHTGLENPDDRRERLIRDSRWAARCLEGDWSSFLRDWDAQPVLQGGFTGARAAREPSHKRRQNYSKGFDVWSLGRQNDLRIALAKLPLPVLWVSGEGDEKYSEIAREAARVTPFGTHVRLGGGGHRVLREAPEALAAVILEFPGASTDVR